MIFSNSTRDIYWILSKLLKNFDISILKRIINEKNRLENKENYDWHIEQGLLLNKLRIKDHKDLFIRKILFNYSKESYQDLNNYHIQYYFRCVSCDVLLYIIFIIKILSYNILKIVLFQPLLKSKLSINILIFEIYLFLYLFYNL